MRQIAGCTHYELMEGQERGVEICDIRTGSGFRFCVSPSRGMDITFAEHAGRPLCWNSSTGVIHPSYYEMEGHGWLRGFYGGLMTTCGLQSFSVSCTDQGEFYGMHDRISYTPASHVNIEEKWIEADGNETFEIAVTGTLRQTRVFGPNVTLTRRISARLGENKIRVHDRIENEGFKPVPWVILYHCNFGFPVVSEHSVVRAPSGSHHTRGSKGYEDKAPWSQMEVSDPTFKEQCFFHAMEADSDGFVQAEIFNQQLNFGGYIRYKLAELPDFTQWKMMGGGDYVCGLEPSNTELRSRSNLREMNILPQLEPGEVTEIDMELGALLGS